MPPGPTTCYALTKQSHAASNSRNHDRPTNTVDGNKQASVFQVLNQHVKSATPVSAKPALANGVITAKRDAVPGMAEQPRSSINDTVSATNATHDSTRRQMGMDRTRLSKNDDNHAENSRTSASARRRLATISESISEQLDDHRHQILLS